MANDVKKLRETSKPSDGLKKGVITDADYVLRNKRDPNDAKNTSDISDLNTANHEKLNAVKEDGKTQALNIQNTVDEAVAKALLTKDNEIKALADQIAILTTALNAKNEESEEVSDEVEPLVVKPKTKGK